MKEEKIFVSYMSPRANFWGHGIFSISVDDRSDVECHEGLEYLGQQIKEEYPDKLRADDLIVILNWKWL